MIVCINENITDDNTITHVIFLVFPAKSLVAYEASDKFTCRLYGNSTFNLPINRLCVSSGQGSLYSRKYPGVFQNTFSGSDFSPQVEIMVDNHVRLSTPN